MQIITEKDNQAVAQSFNAVLAELKENKKWRV